MPHRGIVVALIAGGLIALPAALSAQQATPAAKAKAKQQRTPEPDYDIEELTPGQIQRAQEREQREQRARRNVAPGDTTATSPPASKAAPASPARAVACSGVFAKDTTHLKLATVFAVQNVTFTDVEAPDAAKVMATVLFPKDPKRRLEVWWQNEVARSGVYCGLGSGSRQSKSSTASRSSSKVLTRMAAASAIGRRAHSPRCRAAARSAPGSHQARKRRRPPATR